MLIVETAVRPSPLQGLGLFARQKIAKGETVWRLDPRFDRVVDRATYEATQGAMRGWLDRYGYPYVGDPSRIVFELDDARYMNHSDEPNLAYKSPEELVATRDIETDEEMTVSYSSFLPDGFEFLGDR